MKSFNKPWKWIPGLIGAAALISPFVAAGVKAQGAYAAIRPLESLDSMEVSGAVTAKTDTSLTVENKLIAVSKNTAFTRNGQLIKLDDIQVGDKVKVTTSEGLQGEILALRVEVVTKGDAG